MTFRHSLAILCAFIVLPHIVGCAQLGEQNTIEKFTAALQSEDINGLRDLTSSRFESQALRRNESIDDLRILKLPKDPPTVVKIEEVSDTEKNVTVETEGSGKRLMYRLVQDPVQKQWVVDDIYMKQKKRGLQVTRSVTEQMNLLLSVREFVDAWQAGERAAVIAQTTPDLAELLSALPATALARMTEEIAGSKSSKTRYKPEAQLDEDAAVVRLPRDAGEVLISWKLQDDRWQVDDVSLKRHRNDKAFSGSIRRQAEIVLATSRFLDAYASRDKQLLASMCTNGFYKGALHPSDLSLVPLPVGKQLSDTYEIHGQGIHLSVILPMDQEFVKVDLRGSDDDEENVRDLKIDDVTLYDTQGSQQRRLSSVFTSRARLLICQEALLRGDLKLLKRLSTADLNSRIWNRVDRNLMQQLPFGPATNASREIVQTNFHGDVTEIKTGSGDNQVTWLLSEVSGQLLLDDIRVPSTDMPRSLKTRFDVLIPVAKFLEATLSKDAQSLTMLTTDDFNRLVWKHTKHVPEIDQPLEKMLQAPLHAVKIRGTNAAIVLGDNRFGARLALKQQRNHWVVDDVHLIAGPDRSQKSELKRTYRLVLAEQMRAKSRPEDVLANLPVKPKIRIQKMPEQPAPASWLDEANDSLTVQPMPQGSNSRVHHAGHFVPAAERPSESLRQRPYAQPRRLKSVDELPAIEIPQELPPVKQAVQEFKRVVDPALSPIDIPMD